MDTVDDMTELESLPVEQLVELIRERTGAGVNLSFPGKVLARQLESVHRCARKPGLAAAQRSAVPAQCNGSWLSSPCLCFPKSVGRSRPTSNDCRSVSPNSGGDQPICFSRRSDRHFSAN